MLRYIQFEGLYRKQGTTIYYRIRKIKFIIQINKITQNIALETVILTAKRR